MPECHFFVSVHIISTRIQSVLYLLCNSAVVNVYIKTIFQLLLPVTLPQLQLL